MQIQCYKCKKDFECNPEGKCWCKDFDYKIVKDIIFSEKIDHLAKQIEKDFIKQKTTEYNLKIYVGTF